MNYASAQFCVQLPVKLWCYNTRVGFIAHPIALSTRNQATRYQPNSTLPLTLNYVPHKNLILVKTPEISYVCSELLVFMDE